jgi:amidase
VPVGAKDLCWTKGFPTAAGTTVYKNFRAVEDATVVRRLKDAAAVLLGKLQLRRLLRSPPLPACTEGSMEWLTYWPGISSSGAGVATAAGMCFGAIASDTGELDPLALPPMAARSPSCSDTLAPST